MFIVQRKINTRGAIRGFNVGKVISYTSLKIFKNVHFSKLYILQNLTNFHIFRYF